MRLQPNIHFIRRHRRFDHRLPNGPDVHQQRGASGHDRVDLGRDVDDLPPALGSRLAFATSSSVRPLRDVERDYILSVLQRNGGNRTQTAEQLRIAAATLFHLGAVVSHEQFADRTVVPSQHR